MENDKQSLFSEENKTKSNYMKFENVGDYVSGIYVRRRIIENTMGDKTKKQVVYTLINDEGGQAIDVYAKGKEPQSLPGMESAAFGQHVGIRFDEEIPAKKNGFKPTKIINVYTKGEMHMEVLREFQKRMSGLTDDVEESGGEDEVPFE